MIPFADNLSERRADDIKVEYHPGSGKQPSIIRFEDYGKTSTSELQLPPNATPWRPWRSRTDFDVAALALDCYMNAKQSDRLIQLLHRVREQRDEFTLKDNKEMQKTWDLAAERSTKVHSYPYRSRMQSLLLTFAVQEGGCWCLISRRT